MLTGWPKRLNNVPDADECAVRPSKAESTHALGRALALDILQGLLICSHPITYLQVPGSLHKLSALADRTIVDSSLSFLIIVPRKLSTK